MHFAKSEDQCCFGEEFSIQERNMTSLIAELMTTQMCRQDKCQQQFANWSEEDFRKMTDDLDMQSILILNVDSERNMSISVRNTRLVVSVKKVVHM